MTSPWRLLPLVIVLVLVGCPYIEYQVEMTPQQDGSMRRSITASGHETDPTSELSRIAATYHTTTATLPITGVFREKTPDDVGGHGFFHQYKTSLGSAWVYVENFRGGDQPADVLDKSFKAADIFSDLLAGWLKETYPDSKDAARLADFLQNQARQDARNLLAFGLTFNAAQASMVNGETQENEAVARAAMYLAQRDYLRPEELPLLTHMFDSDYRQEVFKFLRAVAARKAGLADQSLLEKLLPPSEEVAQSFDNYAKEKLASIAATQPELPASPLTLTGALLTPWTQGPGSGSNDFLHLVLHAQPGARTNGNQDPTGDITWAEPLQSAENLMLPRTAYAVWSEPNQATQKRLFGKVVLEETSLVEYVLDSQILAPAQAKRWEAQLGSLTPATSQPALTQLWQSKDPQDEPLKPLAKYLLPPEVTSAPASQPASATAEVKE